MFHAERFTSETRKERSIAKSILVISMKDLMISQTDFDKFTSRKDLITPPLKLSCYFIKRNTQKWNLFENHITTKLSGMKEQIKI